jgi:hypothetical protein
MVLRHDLRAIATACAEGIYERHQRDDTAELMPYPASDAGSLAGILAYIRSHAPADKRLAAEDARDALVVVRYLREWANSIELAMLLLGHDSGLSWLDLAMAEGWQSKQAAQQRVRHLQERAAARLGRDGELTHVAPAKQETGPADPLEAWLTSQAAEIEEISEAVASTVLPDAETKVVTPAQDSAEELLLELAWSHSPRELMKWLTILLNELRDAGGLDVLAPRVREQAAGLVGEWKRLLRAGSTAESRSAGISQG